MALITLGLLHSVKPAFAIDPFTIAAVVSSVASAVDKASDAGDTANAFNELYSEIDNEAMVSDGGQKVINRIQEIESMANELGYTTDELNSLSHEDKENFAKISYQLREVTKAIKAGKRLAKLVTSTEKKAQQSQIEQNQVAQQQLAIQMNQMYEAQANSLNGVKAELENAVRQKAQIISLRQKMKVGGVRVFNNSKTLVFPVSEGIVEAAIELGKKIQPILFKFIILVIGLRILYYQASFKSSNYLNVIKDAALCMLFILFLPTLVHIILACSSELASAVTRVSGVSTPNIIDPKDFKAPDLGKGGILTGISIDWYYQWFMYIVYVVTEMIMSVALGFMVVVMPIVIFLGVGFNVPLIWTAFLLAFSVMTLWPALWNIIGALSEMVWAQDGDTLKTVVYSSFASLFQLVSPFFIGRIIKGEGVHSMASQAASQGSQYSSTAMSHANNFEQSLKNTLTGEGKGGSGFAGTLGGVIGQTANQVVSRAKNAKEAFDGSQSNVAPPSAGSRLKQAARAAKYNTPFPTSGVKSFAAGFKNQKLSKGTNNV